MGKTVVVLAFGGRSPEHEVSLVSAREVFENIDRERYELILAGIDKSGVVRVGPPSLLEGGLARGEGAAARWPAHPGDRRLRSEDGGEALSPHLDVLFPLIHGFGGEDGSIQGVAALAGIPVVGAGVLGSSLAMDKDRARRLLAAEGVPVVRDAVFRAGAARDARLVAGAAADLGWPVFIKPARAGSSVGISKVESEEGIPAALEQALAFDEKIVVERAVPEAGEIELAVLGDEHPEVTCPGEILPHGEFYSYEAKYDDSESRLLIPASLPTERVRELQSLALRAFSALELAGMARVDFLLSRATGELVLNEVNTIPGFTPISMYPKLWQAEGLTYRELVHRLIELALAAR